MIRQHELNIKTCEGCSLTLAVAYQDDVSRYGRVLLEQDKVLGFEEKGRTGAGWINAGVYLLEQSFTWPQELGFSFSFEREVLGPHLRILRPGIFRALDYFVDIGVPEDLERAQVDFGRPA